MTSNLTIRDLSASAQYEAAFRMSLHMSRKSKGRSSLGGNKRDELRAVQKLGDALLLLGRDEEARQLLEALLHRLRKISDLRKEEIVQYVLKARLTLAETYLKRGRTRSAIAYYWHILRQSDWLPSEVLRDVATRLRSHKPELSERQQRWINGIIGARDEVMTDVGTIQHMLSRL